MTVTPTPVVVISGMNCSPRLWQDCQLPEGAVSIAPSGATLEEAVAQVRQHITQPSILVGLSLGGIVAMALARQHPQEVAGMLLISTNARAPRPEQLESWQATAQRVQEGLAPRDFQEEILGVLLSPAGVGNKNSREQTLAIAEETSPELLIEQLLMQTTRVEERAHLGHLTVPVEVLCGDVDALCPVERHTEIAQEIHGSHLEILPGVGHLIPIENPAAITDALRRIQRRVAVARSLHGGYHSPG